MLTYQRYKTVCKELYASIPRLTRFDLSYDDIQETMVCWLWGPEPNLTEEYLIETLEGRELL